MLMRLANLLAAVFMLDKSRDIKQVFKTLRRLQRVIRKMTPEDFQRFKTFCLKIFAPQLPPEKQQEIARAMEKFGPEESERMVTNIERIVEETFRKARQESLSQGMAQGLAQGIAQGIAQGELKKAQESALAALQEGLDPQLVSKITGLSLDKVLELQKQILH